MMDIDVLHPPRTAPADNAANRRGPSTPQISTGLAAMKLSPARASCPKRGVLSPRKSIQKKSPITPGQVLALAIGSATVKKTYLTSYGVENDLTHQGVRGMEAGTATAKAGLGMLSPRTQNKEWARRVGQLVGSIRKNLQQELIEAGKDGLAAHPSSTQLLLYDVPPQRFAGPKDPSNPNDAYQKDTLLRQATGGTYELQSNVALYPSLELGAIEGQHGLSDGRTPHTIAKHVHKTDTELVERLQNNPSLSASTSFSSLPTAQFAVDGVMVSNQNQLRIHNWLQSSAEHNLQLYGRALGRPLGGGFARDKQDSSRFRQVSDMDAACVVLAKRKDASNSLTPYTVISAMPMTEADMPPEAPASWLLPENTSRKKLANHIQIPTPDRLREIAAAASWQG